MSVALPAQRHALDMPVTTVLRLDGKIGAPEYLATGLAQHVTHVVATHGEDATIRFDLDRRDAPGGRALLHGDHARAARMRGVGGGAPGSPARGVRREIALQRGAERRGRDRLAPVEV